MSTTNRIIQLATHAGRIILQNGGEIYRVEETVDRICISFGVRNCQSYATPTALIVSVVNQEGESISAMERIHTRSVNLDKVDAINRLSRTLETDHPDLDAAYEMLEEINRRPSRPAWMIVLFSALACGAFTFLFRGGPWDIFPAFVAGALIRVASLFLARIKLNDFFVNVIGSFIGNVTASLMVLMGIGQNVDAISISALMLLVPGLAITNAVRDITAGDLISGISRVMEAFFVAIALACGTALSFMIFSWIGGVPA